MIAPQIQIVRLHRIRISLYKGRISALTNNSMTFVCVVLFPADLSLWRGLLSCLKTPRIPSPIAVRRIISQIRRTFSTIPIITTQLIRYFLQFGPPAPTFVSNVFFFFFYHFCAFLITTIKTNLIKCFLYYNLLSILNYYMIIY